MEFWKDSEHEKGGDGVDCLVLVGSFSIMKGYQGAKGGVGGNGVDGVLAQRNPGLGGLVWVYPYRTKFFGPDMIAFFSIVLLTILFKSSFPFSFVFSLIPFPFLGQKNKKRDFDLPTPPPPAGCFIITGFYGGGSFSFLFLGGGGNIRRAFFPPTSSLDPSHPIKLKLHPPFCPLDPVRVRVRRGLSQKSPLERFAFCVCVLCFYQQPPPSPSHSRPTPAPPHPAPPLPASESRPRDDEDALFSVGRKKRIT